MKENDRLKLFISYLKSNKIIKSQKELGVLLEYKTESAFSQVVSGIVPIPESLYSKLKTLYPFVNMDWIRNGVGEMLNPKDGVTQIDSDNYIWVEFDDLSASAGPLGGNDVDELPRSKKRLVPREFDNGEYLVVRVDGDSMDNGTNISIPDGTEILIKKYYLNNGDKLPIRGNLFVIVAKEGRALKQIIEHNTDKGYIVCHSYNPEYKDYTIPMDEVLEIYLYRKVTSSRPPIPDINR